MAILESDLELLADPEAAARSAGLLYVTDDTPGYTRRRCGTGFTYRLPDGTTLRDPAERSRIEGLAIPPAWTDVWICVSETGHLQATGRDDRDRKQYLYHELWRAVRDHAKFQRLVRFGHELPRLRRKVGRDLSREGLSRERVLAAAVRLLDRTAIRVGSPEYARENESFGLTTLRTRHTEIRGDALLLEFRGKAGRAIELEVRDPDLASILRASMSIPGWVLFQYLDDDGGRHGIDADDVNAYLGAAMSGRFTAKDFRTWLGTVEVVRHLLDGDAPTPDQRKNRWLEAVDAAAAALFNTRAVARSSYVPPDLESLYLEGELRTRVKGLEGRAAELAVPGRRREERVALALLEHLVGHVQGKAA